MQRCPGCSLMSCGLGCSWHLAPRCTVFHSMLMTQRPELDEGHACDCVCAVPWCPFFPVRMMCACHRRRRSRGPRPGDGAPPLHAVRRRGAGRAGRAGRACRDSRVASTVVSINCLCHTRDACHCQRSPGPDAGGAAVRLGHAHTGGGDDHTVLPTRATARGSALRTKAVRGTGPKAQGQAQGSGSEDRLLQRETSVTNRYKTPKLSWR
jgi:hypothetical protein